MVEKLTSEEISALSGEDIDDIRDEEHPEGSLDEDFEGTGVDDPDMDSAAGDDELAEEDKDDIHLRDVDWETISREDWDIYLTMDALRQSVKEGEKDFEIAKDADELAVRIREMQSSLEDDDRHSRENFLAMINNKLTNISLELQAASSNKRYAKRKAS